MVFQFFKLVDDAMVMRILVLHILLWRDGPIFPFQVIKDCSNYLHLKQS